MVRFEHREVRMTIKRLSKVAWVALLGSIAWVGVAGAQKVSSEEAAGYLVFPKVVVDPSGRLSDGVPKDTVVRITNTSDTATSVHCFYVDGTPRCTIGGGLDGDGACETNEDCDSGGICTLASCQAINFDLNLTANQPVGWRASQGVVTAGFCVGGTSPGFPCSQNSDCSGVGVCQAQDIGRVPPLAPGIFLGELKCVQVVGTGTDPNIPVNRNDLVGNASIYRVDSGLVDVQTYNAVGVQAVASDGSAQNDTSLVLGGGSREYAGCPAQLVVDHFFDDAALSAARRVTSDITLVPCSERLEVDDNPAVHTLQFLVFNEFEQRMSASTRFRCFRETQLSRLDRRVGQEGFSVFNVGVQGTLAGQTVIRPVLTGDGNPGNGILAVVEEFHRSRLGIRSAAFNVHLRGDKSQPDTVAY